jgi:hypothetical protein|tara:strand:- start:1435 stop:2781 length:1347 start_codon:yes stop_codon:yes gene_type:complete
MSTKSYRSILPNNVPSTGKVSFARGNPIITVTLGRQDAMLDLSSLRLSGNLDIWSNAAGTQHPTAGGGGVAARAVELQGSHKLGIYSCIDQLVFRHAETKQVIEHIRHYGRFMSSYMPVMAGMQDVAGHLSKSALIMPNYQAYRDNVIRNTRNSVFCIPLPAGLTLGVDKLPLDKVPLEIEIHLAPDSQFFYSSDATTTNISNAFYELSGLELTCEIETGVKSPDKGVLDFNSITSYFSTLESTNSIINFNLGLSKVLASFVNFVPANFVNNLSQDGFLTYMPTLKPNAAADPKDQNTLAGVANLDTISFLRNGERFPSSFEVESVYDATTNATSVVDPQVIKSFLGAIIPERVHTRTTASPATTNRGYTGNQNALTGYRYVPDAGAVYGVGVLYDMLDSEGVDFSSSQFSIQMKNGLVDGNPISAYLFIKSKVVVAWSGDMGVQVVM